ncbi:MAG: ABC transporter permease [Clostridiales bacterium]|nr:ABC transporter permease [Candidatus Apopatocola equi]
MKQYRKSILTALVCFFAVIVLNFLLPRLLPGDPVAYLTGFAEEDMSPEVYEKYRAALHLDESGFSQFFRYLHSLADGTLGYSYKKEQTVSVLIGEKLGCTLQITLPALLLSTLMGLFWGLDCAWRKGSAGDRLSTALNIVVNAVPTFVMALAFIYFFCFRNRIFPYTGLNSDAAVSGTAAYVLDRLQHLALPVLTLTAATAPSRFLLMRNTAEKVVNEKYVLYARERGLSAGKIKRCYILPNIAQPFISMVGMSMSTCVGGSLVIENIFSIPGMGRLLTDAIYSLDYPLMQGILFVTTLMMVIAIILTDILCILTDPRARRGRAA